MNMQKYATFVRKSLKINMQKMKCCKVRNHCHYTSEYRGAAGSTCKIHNLFSSSWKEVTRIGKNGEKILIAQELN